MMLINIHVRIKTINHMQQTLQRKPIANGLARGNFNEYAYAFRGIPYALPPTGNRRWQPPEALSKTSGTCWSGTYDASKFKEQCVQRDELSVNKAISGSEDCLYLNVWTPTLNNTANLPVMVWIHGGALVFGNGNRPTYSPTEELSHDTNIVYVSMNYRLNAFGFMALDILSQNSNTNTSGNYGFMDQIQVLKWVKDNIRNFGGDPHQVTIFGQSSGGTSVLALMISPLTQGLFSKAWMMSGSPKINIPTSKASVDNLGFLNNTRCNDLSCLQQLSARDVIDAVPWSEYPFWGMGDSFDVPTKGLFLGAIVVVDGFVIPESSEMAWLNGNARDVPLLIGSMAQEIDSPGLVNTWSEYETKVHDKLGSFGEPLFKMAMKMYPSGQHTPSFQYGSMGSDIRVSCPTDLLTLYASVNSNSPVYRYVSTFQTSSPPKEYGVNYTGEAYSFHTLDAYGFFGSIKDILSHPTTNDVMFTTNIRREVMSFVKHGVPFSKNWRTFPRNTVLLSYETTVSDGYHPQKCNFWFANEFEEYAWIN